jgi:hypothetical protein
MNMRRFFVSLGLIGSVFLIGEIRADPPARGTTPENAPPNTQQTTEKLPPGEYVGRLVAVDARANTLVLRITTQRRVLKNPDGPTRTFDEIVQDTTKEEQKIGQLYQDAAISRSMADYQRKQKEINKAVSEFQQKSLPKQLNDMAQQQANPQPVEYVTVTERKDAKLTTVGDVKVRLREPPSFDDDGNVKRYTAEDLLKLKGKDPLEPGYNGKLGNLRPGDYLRVTVAAKDPAKETEKKADQRSDPAVASSTEVTAITVVTKEQAEKQEPSRP